MSKMYSLITYVIMISIIVFNCSSGDELVKSSKKTEDIDSQIGSITQESGTYFYKDEKYNSQTKKDYFSKEDIIQLSELKRYGLYYKVYYDKDNTTINKVEEYKGGRVVGYRLYSYENKQLSSVTNYIGKTKTSVGTYDDGVLKKIVKYGPSGNLMHYANCTYKNGKRYLTWYDAKKKKLFSQEFNDKGKITILKSFSDAKQILLSKFIYNDDGLLIKQERRIDKELQSYATYFYDKVGNLAVQYLIENDKTSQAIYYNPDGSIRRKEVYDNKGLSGSYSLFSYSADGTIRERFFNTKNRLLYQNVYDSIDRKISHAFYLGAEQIEQSKYLYDGDSSNLKKIEVYVRDNLESVTNFENGQVASAEYYKDGSIISSWVYEYRKDGKVSTATKYDKGYNEIASWKYDYDKNNQLISESLYVGNKMKSEKIYSYSSKGLISKIEEKVGEQIISLRSFDEKGREVEFLSYNKGAVAQKTTMEYDKNGLKTSENVFTGGGEMMFYTTFHYDENKKNLRQEGYSGKGELVWTRYFFYDANGNKIKEIIVDNLGKPIETVYYDLRGLPIHSITHQKPQAMKERKVDKMEDAAEKVERNTKNEEIE